MVSLPKKDDGQFGYLTDYQPGFPLMPLPYAAPLDNDNNLGMIYVMTAKGGCPVGAINANFYIK